MKILIIYDSIYKNTEKIAESIKKNIKGEIKLIKIDNFNKNDLKKINLLIIGSPTHAGRGSEKINNFLKSINNNELKDIKIAVFDTGINSKDTKLFLKIVIKILGYASKYIEKELIKKGAISIIKPKTFFVLDKKGPLKEKELEYAKNWANKINSIINK
jgi:flavodoxin